MQTSGLVAIRKKKNASDIFRKNIINILSQTFLYFLFRIIPIITLKIIIIRNIFLVAFFYQKLDLLQPVVFSVCNIACCNVWF